MITEEHDHRGAPVVDVDDADDKAAFLGIGQAVFMITDHRGSVPAADDLTSSAVPSVPFRVHGATSPGD